MATHAPSTNDKKRHLTFFALPCFVISCLLTAVSSVTRASTEADYQPALPKNSLITLNPEIASIPGIPKDTTSGFTFVIPLPPEAEGQAPRVDHSQLVGDAHYLRELVNQEVLRRTGHRYLHGHSDDNKQFRDLYAHGQAFLDKHQIAPGVALTPEQMTRLTDDMVLMVNKTITLPDGRKVERLMPQLYTRIRPKDISGKPVISGNHVNLKGNTLANRAAISGRDTLNLRYDHIDQQGILASNHGKVHASDTFRGRGGEIRAGEFFSATAGKVFDFGSETETILNHDGKSYDNTHRLRDIGKLTRTEDNSTVILGGARQTTLGASDIALGGKDSRTIITGGDVHLGAEYVFDEKLDYRNAGNFDYLHQGQHRGLQSSGEGNLDIVATRGKVTGIAAELDSSAGKINVYGKDGVDIRHGTAIHKEAHAADYKKSRFLSKKHVKSYEEHESREAIGSVISGNTVHIAAGQRGDIHIEGSHIVSDHGTALSAGGDIRIRAAQNSYKGQSNSHTRKSGLMGSSGGFGFTIGQRKQKDSSSYDLTAYSPSLVGALDGNVSIDAGGHYENFGSIVHAGRKDGPLNKAEWLALPAEERSRAGNLFVNAQSAKVTHAQGNLSEEQYRFFQQSGLSVTVGGSAIAAVQTALQTMQTLAKTGDSSSRVQGMAAANAAWNTYQSAQTLSQAASGNTSDLINVSITVGSQRRESKRQSSMDNMQASQLTADGGAFFRVKGKGADSTLDVTGSDVAGSAYTAFDVDGQKTFQAAELKSRQSSSNKSSGWNAGVALSFGQGASLGFTGGGNYGRGYSDGKGTHYRLAHAGSQTGHTDLGDGKTTLIGAQIRGKGISGNTRDLTIISPQGLQQYDSRQFDASGQLTIGYGVSGGGSFAYSKVHQDHKSITLPDGRKVERLVPQLYTRVRPRDIAGQPVISANQVKLRGNTLANRAAISGRDTLDLRYDHIDQQGILTSNHGKVFDFVTTTLIHSKKEINEKVLGAIQYINSIEDLGYNFHGMDSYANSVISSYQTAIQEGKSYDEAYRIATNTSTPGLTFAQTHEKVTGFVSSAAQTSATFAIDIAKFSLDFLILDDLKSIVNPQSPKEFFISAVSITPAGKPLKLLKAGSKADKANDIRKAVDNSQIARQSSNFSTHIGKEKAIQENIQKRIDNPDIGIEELMKKSSRLGDTKGKAIQFDRFEKGFNQANIDFEFLKPNNIRGFEDGKLGRLGTLNDGSNVNVRLDSTANRPTLEIQNEKNSFKFRY